VKVATHCWRELHSQRLDADKTRGIDRSGRRKDGVHRLRFRGRVLWPPVLGPAKVVAAVAIVPWLLAFVVLLPFEIWRALRGKPDDLLALLGSLLLWLGLYTLPILGGLWLGASRLRSVEAALSKRKRTRPRLPASFHQVRFTPDLESQLTGLPLFDRALAHLWSTVAHIDIDGIGLKVFELVHGDLLGERGGTTGRVTGLSIVSCAAIHVGGNLPLVVVRPARSKPFALPDRMTRRTTELGRFNESFKLFSAEPYAASALVDARTIAAIQEFDPRFSVEIGGEWVLVHAPRLRAFTMERLIRDAAALARVFPKMASSLYPSRGH
jgi:hypothetical protein